jgi:diaminopimelate decarboxylase
VNFFEYRNGELMAEDIPLTQLAREVGTPAYIYSKKTLAHHFRVFDDAFGTLDHLICFAMKANSNLSILSLFISMGAGVDIVSGGELFRACTAGVDPRKVVYSGVGKTHEEIRQALTADILMFNVESFQELFVIDELAREMNRTARISVRVNPDVDPKTHPKISTGLKSNKFGIDIRKVVSDYEQAGRLKNIQVVGVDCHIGSQVTELGPFVDALGKIKELVLTLRDRGMDIRYLDFGGGLGITYRDEEPPDPSSYGRAIGEIAGDLGVTFVLEPGRVLVGNAGILLTRVLYTKQAEKNFVIVDAGMNDLARPAVYDSYHEVRPVIKKDGPVMQADVVGPICESSDYLAKDRQLVGVERDDLIAVMSAGAYSFSMSSNYNSRPRAVEVLVDGGSYRVIRQRERYEDLVQGEIVA